MGLVDGIHAAFHQPSTRVYSLVQGVVWALIVISILILVAEPFLPEGGAGIRVFEIADLVILGIFAVEVTLRIASYRPPELEVFEGNVFDRVQLHVLRRLTYALTPLVLVDLITVLALVPALRGLRAIRLLRLLRSVRVFRYSNPFAGLMAAFERDRLLFTFAFAFLGTVVLIGGFSLFLVERAYNDDIRDLGDAIWWALVTVTTVGYGDITPVTFLGRVIAGAVMIGGMFNLAMFAGIVGHSLLYTVLSIREEQFRMSSYVNHVVLCGYDSSTHMLLETLSEEIDFGASKAVIFAEQERPVDVPPEFLWVQGDPTKASELDKVRLTHASAVIVAGKHAAPRVGDAQTLLTLFTIRKYMLHRAETYDRKKPLYVVAEILDSENVDHALTAGADEVIETRMIGNSLIAHAIGHHGTATALSHVVISGAHNAYIGIVPDEIELPVKFGELLIALALSKRGGLIIGVRTASGQEVINPPKTFMMKPGSTLIYLAEEPLLEPPQ